jgi:hypothetical protein
MTDGLAGFTDDKITAKLAETANQVSGSKEVDEGTIRESPDCDACKPLSAGLFGK